MQKPKKILVLVGRRLEKIRKAAKLTQEQLSEKSGVSTKMLSLMENGSVAASLTTLDDVARALRVPMAQFVFEPDEIDQEIAATLVGRTRADRRRALAVILSVLAPVQEE